MPNSPVTDSEAWVKPGSAAGQLGVSLKTLAKLADEGHIRARKLPGGHRRYLQSSIDALAALGEGHDGDSA